MVYKTKLNLNSDVQKNKARLVAKGCAQKLSLDFNEMFALAVRLNTICILIALTTKKGLKLFQFCQVCIFGMVFYKRGVC